VTIITTVKVVSLLPAITSLEAIGARCLEIE